MFIDSFLYIERERGEREREMCIYIYIYISLIFLLGDSMSLQEVCRFYSLHHNIYYWRAASAGKNPGPHVRGEPYYTQCGLGLSITSWTSFAGSAISPLSDLELRPTAA